MPLTAQINWRTGIFLIIPALQAVIATQAPPALVSYWMATAILSAAELILLRKPVKEIRRKLNLPVESVYLFPDKIEDCLQAVRKGYFDANLSAAKATFQRSQILEKEVKDILMKSLDETYKNYKQ